MGSGSDSGVRSLELWSRRFLSIARDNPRYVGAVPVLVLNLFAVVLAVFLVQERLFVHHPAELLVLRVSSFQVLRLIVNTAVDDRDANAGAVIAVVPNHVHQDSGRRIVQGAGDLTVRRNIIDIGIFR